MNIVIINHYAIAPTAAGITRHFSFARELVRRGHRVTIVASSFDHQSRMETREWGRVRYQTENLDGIHFVWIKTPPYRGNTFARIRNMISFSYELLRLPFSVLGLTPDVVLGSSPHLFAPLAAQQIARRLQVPFVLEIRDLWPESLTALGDISPIHPFIMLLSNVERFLYRRADHLITLLPRASDHMVNKGANVSRITWVPNGIDLKMVPDIQERPHRQPLIGMYAGTHGLANGLDLLLDSAKILQDTGLGDKVHFRLVGDGPEKLRLIERAATEGLSNISFEEAVPKSDVYNLLLEADFFPVVLRDSPLYQWGISLNKLFDYMAVGRPIVFSGDAPSNPVEMGGAGILTKSGDAAALADGIRQIAELSADDRREYSQRARAYVAEHHSMSVLGERLESVLSDVIGGYRDW